MKTKRVWIAWVNSDGTEGKGFEYPFAISESRACAVRMGRKQDVQGTDATVQSFEAVNLYGHWLAPFWLEMPTREDEYMDKQLEAAEAAAKKAKELGLTEDEIRAMLYAPSSAEVPK